MSVTIKDIAKHCRVSVATVSRAMNNTSYVEPEKKEFILRYAQEQGWQASNIATTLKSGKSKTVGIMANTLGGNNNKVIVENIAIQLQAKGLHTFIGLYGTSPESQLKVLSSYQSRQLDALAIIAPKLKALEAEIKTFIKKQTNVILVNEEKLPGCALATFDFKEQGRMAMQYLLNSGHQEILFISQLGHHKDAKAIKDFSSVSTPSLKQVAGVFEVAKAAGINFNVAEHIYSDNYKDFSYIEQALKKTNATAIICCTPYLTAKIYQLIQKYPQELTGKFTVFSIGWNDLMLGFSPVPACLDTGIEELGAAISQLILETKYDSAKDIYIKPRLVIGDNQ